MACLQGALKQLLQQGIGSSLFKRIALRLQDLPILSPQCIDEFVGYAGFSDPRGSYQSDDLSGRPNIAGGPLEKQDFLGAPDKGRKPLG